MDVLEIGVAAGGEGAQKIEGRGGLAIGFQLPARVGLAGGGCELDVVDDVAAIGRQGDAVDRLQVGGAGLGELAGDAADLHDRRRGGEGHHHRHLQEHAEEVADVVGRMLAETLGAISTLEQERIARGRLAQSLLELARFTCKNQRRKAGKLALGFSERRAIGIGGRLGDRLCPPAIRGPTLALHSRYAQYVPYARPDRLARVPMSGGRAGKAPFWTQTRFLTSRVSPPAGSRHCSRDRWSRPTRSATASTNRQTWPPL